MPHRRLALLVALFAAVISVSCYRASSRIATIHVPDMESPRDERIVSQTRNEKWRNVPLRIEMSECINCDACLRHCPPHFGAIFNHGLDVIIIPELCSGCGKCVEGARP